MEGVGTGATFGVAVGVETKTAGFGFGVTGETGSEACWAVVVGCSIGLGNLVWACSDVAEGASGTASLHLTLHSLEVTSDMVIDSYICKAYIIAVLGKDADYSSGYPVSSGCQIWQWADQHETVQFVWSAYQCWTWLDLQGALELGRLLGQCCGSWMVWWYASCNCTASERVMGLWHHLVWSWGAIVWSLDLYHCTWHFAAYAWFLNRLLTLFESMINWLLYAENKVIILYYSRQAFAASMMRPLHQV